MKSLIKTIEIKAWHKYLVMCRFDFRYFFDLWLNRFYSIGFAILTFDNMNEIGVYLPSFISHKIDEYG